jgi:hypothetical protein
MAMNKKKQYLTVGDLFERTGLHAQGNTTFTKSYKMMMKKAMME